MGFVLLVVRFIVGGYFAWQGARHLDAYGRHHLVASARAQSLPMALVSIPLFGLMLTIGGVSLVTGLFPAGGVVLLFGFLIPSAFLMRRFWSVGTPSVRVRERRRFAWNVAFAIVALMMLLVPQPWPLTVAS